MKIFLSTKATDPQMEWKAWRRERKGWKKKDQQEKELKRGKEKGGAQSATKR